MLKDVLREFLYRNKLLEIFEKYCAAWLKNDEEEEESFLTKDELKIFFAFEQNQSLRDVDIFKIFEIYGENVKSSLLDGDVKEW